MTRQQRLTSVRATCWIEKYEGNNIIKGYSKWFAVDSVCAIIELRMLGVTITEEWENKIKSSILAQATARKRRRELVVRMKSEEFNAYSDDTFAYIAGYTPGGAPYGTTWEGIGEDGPP